MTSPRLVAPIVGAQFRPPAALLLRVLPTHHPLYIESEPLNEYDPDAIRVMLDLSTLDVDNEAIANILTNANLTNPSAINDFVTNNSLHLGYVARSSNSKSCQIDNKPSMGNTEIINALTHLKFISPRLNPNWRRPAHLTFSMSGQPLVEVTTP